MIAPEDHNTQTMQRHADAVVELNDIHLSFHWMPELGDAASLQLYKSWAQVGEMRPLKPKPRDYVMSCVYMCDSV